MTRALVALGSNLGEPAAQLQQAVDLLQAAADVEVQRVSRWHATKPIGGPGGQNEFLNAAAILETSRSPQRLLQLLQEIEKRLGRVRLEHWGPRTLDLDLLLYGDEVIDTPELQVPHPRMVYRRFVIDPAAEIAPDWVHPLLTWRLDRLQAHLAGEPRYLALAAPGPLRPALTALARKAAYAAGRASVWDVEMPENSGKDLFKKVLFHAALISSLRYKGEPYLADYWLGEVLLKADAHFPADRPQIEQYLREKAPVSAPRVILVWAPQNWADSLLPSRTAAERPCENLAIREQLSSEVESWSRAVRQELLTGEPGPWIWLDTVDQQRVHEEIVAILAALE